MNKKIKNSIYTFRNQNGFLDRDIASLLDIETKVFNQAIKRHQNNFSQTDTFILEKDEFHHWKSQFVTANVTANEELKTLEKIRSFPTFFTKSGIEKCLPLFKKESQTTVLKKIIIALDSKNIDIIFPDSELKNDVFTYISKNGDVVFDVKIYNETVWITQQQMADLFESTKQNISFHLTNIFDEKELEKNSVVKDYLTTAQDGKEYIIAHYNLDAILSVGYRINGKKGTQFRQWATHILKQHLINGYSIKENIAQKQLDNALSRISALEARVNQLPLSNDILNNIDFINLIKASPSKKHKISNTTLIILCEGKTDIVYIKKAITLFSPNLNLDSIKFVDAEGHKNLKSVLDTYKKQDIGMKILHPSLFVFDCDVPGINNETKDNVISYIFKRKCTEENHVYQRGIENNFHNSVFLKLFDQKISSIKLIKEISNTPTGQQETLINVSFDKVTLCNALFQHGTKDDFIHFKDIVSLITQLVGYPQITRS